MGVTAQASLGWLLSSGACTAYRDAIAAPASARRSLQPSGNVIAPSLLMQAAALSGVAISANGQLVAVRQEQPNLTSNTVTLRWYILRLSNGMVVAQADGGRADWHWTGLYARGNAQWSTDSRWLYFSALKEGKLELWRLGVNGRVGVVISSSSDIDGFSLDEERHRILYWTGPPLKALAAAKNDEYRQGVILRANGTQEISQPLEDNLPYRTGITTMRWGRLGESTVMLPVGDQGVRTEMAYDMKTTNRRAIARSDAARYRYNFETDSIKPVTTVGGVGTVISLARSALTGDVAFIVQRKSAERGDVGQVASSLVLGLKKAGSGKIVWCKDRRCSHLTDRVVWRPGTEEFMFVALGGHGHVNTGDLNGGRINMYAWNPQRNKIRLVLRTTGEIGAATGLYVPSQQCPVSAIYAVCVIERDDEPPKLVRINLDNGSRTDLFDPNAGLRRRLIAAGIPAHIARMHWRDARGLMHTGVFLSGRFADTSSRAPPLVITSYDCLGFLRGGTGSTTPEFVLWADGFAVLCSNLDEALTAPGYPLGRVPPGYATDVEYMFDGWKAAVQLLAHRKLVDPKRVGISGLSFTGEAVNYVVTHHPQFAAAATAGHLGGMTDPIAYYIEGGIGGRRGRDIIRGYPLPDPRSPNGHRYFSVVSNALNAGRICTPVLEQTNEAEFGVDLEYYGALRLENAPVEVIVFPAESHVFWQPQHLLLVQERNVAWFRWWLEDYNAQNALMDASYARWERLREQNRSGCASGLSPLSR